MINPRILNKAFLLAGLILSGGCVGHHIERSSSNELIEMLGRAQQADRCRLAAVDSLTSRKLDENQQQSFAAALGKATASSVHSSIIRSRYAEVLARQYRDAAPEWLGKALINTVESPLRSQLLTLLIELDSESSLGYLVTALSETKVNTPLASTDIAQAITLIADKSLEESLTNQLRGSESLRAVIASLTCLERLMGHEQVRQILLSIPGNDALRVQ